MADKRGGARAGAGRKKGSSAYGESTRAIRVPESMLPELKAVLALRKQSPAKRQGNAVDHSALALPAEILSQLDIPLFNGKVSAGFPSPADDYIEKTLDLNELLVQKPAATFFVRAEGESMLGAGIHPNDILVVDRSLESVVGKIVICALNGELTVKRLKSIGKEIVLAAESPAYADIIVQEYVELVIWGVVTNVIHSL
ncbi:DNA polymerase V [Bathymodiolus japonicus methanotrophic gill symbiont]|uniref:LexA family protein n=1 Tax=Bathymodiolus japonicus methanotrophic gill symbiont TaxID=113269 RepID=UPI001B72147D|nr:translesion error-prone DNA polymerase V autoproteolytic subunit [Bathymodiolus japonicus methanotrophic gill symbiont]GFO71002.1 DNA polymerase V [Bathymodiolus japonicus methanotrophic gill symbiont]